MTTITARIDATIARVPAPLGPMLGRVWRYVRWGVQR